MVSVVTSTTGSALAAHEAIPKRKVVAWAFWDWGTQPFATVITTFVFAVYLTSSAFGEENQTSIAMSISTGIAGLGIALLTPVLGAWDGSYPIRPVRPEEVSDVLTLPVTRLADPQVRACSVHPSGHTGPAFVLDHLFIWGFTAHLLSWVLELGGWARPWDGTRLLEVPERFQRDRKPSA